MPSTLLAVAGSHVPAAPVIGLMAFAVVLALVGHIAHDNRVVGVGLAVLFLATGAMVVSGLVAYNDDPADPRPCRGLAPGAC